MTDKDKAESVDRLEQLFVALGLPEDELDETVHELFAETAAAANNGGPYEQITRLLEHGYDEAALEKLLRDLAGTKTNKRIPRL